MIARLLALREGEDVKVEATTADGLVVFQTEVVSRDPETHELVVRIPEGAHPIDRRSDKRMIPATNRIKIDGAHAVICDIARGGAKVVADVTKKPGERIRLDGPGDADPCYGWVLDSEVQGGTCKMRVAFESPADLRKSGS